MFDKLFYHSAEGSLSEMEAFGRVAYLSIDKTVRLGVIIHQQGPDQAAFRDALTAVRTRRFHPSMTEDEIHSFQDAVRIYTLGSLTSTTIPRRPIQKKQIRIICIHPRIRSEYSASNTAGG